MKRKLILLVVTIVFLVGFGAILHSPPSMIDAVTGATPKSKKAAQASAQLEGSYVLGINMMSDGLDNENTRNKLKELALDDSETNETDLMKTDISFRLYVSETDYPLVSYAKKLCDRLKQAGFFVDLKEYSNTMMLSRVVSGKYDVFLASDDFIDVTTLTQMDYMNKDYRYEQKLSYHLYRCKREQNICPILHLSKQANMEEQKAQYCQPTGSSRPEYGVLFQIHFSGLLRCL